MNISYNWLKQYIDTPLTPHQLADTLTSIGLETGSIEEVESIRGGLRGIVVGHVLTCVEHPDSDHLHITTVDLGLEAPVQIVCGAPNVAAGQYVIVATVGTTLYDADGNEFKIKRSKIRGVESLGMICAEDEIGVGTSHNGIIVLPEPVKPGTPAAEYYKLTSDWVLEVDLTPNRIDAASHYGVARDLSAWAAFHAEPTPLKRPATDSFKPDRKEGGINVQVEASDLCTRYCGLTIRGVKVASSPDWLRTRLETIGIRSINNVVDITNYILHGIGQPLHAFDLGKITGSTIHVTTLPEGTQFTTLDGIERKLSAADLMICSDTDPLCLAGVFGGQDSGVTDNTTDIFIESACFDPTTVRRSARRHTLSTDSSFRFERGTDPSLPPYALRLAALMIKQIAGGEICGEPIDIYPNPVSPYPVELDYTYARALIGKQIPTEQIDTILRSLEISVDHITDDKAHLLVPTYRIDVRRPCDVVEDLLRIYGYNNIELSTTVHSSLSYKSISDSDHALTTTIADQLTAQGFNEILCNSLTAESYYRDSPTYPIECCVRLLNPLSSDLSVMRQTLLYGGLEVLAHNINRRIDSLSIYEFGNTYTLSPQAESTADHPLAPYSQQSRLAIWTTGQARTASWTAAAEPHTIYHLRATVANILARLGINSSLVKLEQTHLPIYAHALTISSRSGEQIGHMGILNDALLRQHDIKQPVQYAELNWSTITKLARRHKVSFTPVPKTMAVKRDLALLVDTATTFDTIEQAVRRAGGKLLQNVTLFDVYEGNKLPAGKKSYAIAITLQDPERTLNDKQIDAIMTKILKSIKQNVGATLR